MTALMVEVDCARRQRMATERSSSKKMRRADEMRPAREASPRPREMAPIVFIRLFSSSEVVYSIIESDDECGELLRLQLDGHLVCATSSVGTRPTRTR